MVKLEEIANEVLQILNNYGYQPAHVSIDLDFSKQVFVKLQVADSYVINDFQVRRHGLSGEIGWHCVISCDIYAETFMRMASTPDKRLMAIMDEFYRSFKLVNAPIQAYQVLWVLQKADFDDKFANHPNLVVEHHFVQAAQDIEGTYCSIVIEPILSPSF